jgi:hypothetical protein
MINYRALTRGLFRAFATKSASKKPKTEEGAPAGTKEKAAVKNGVVS